MNVADIVLNLKAYWPLIFWAVVLLGGVPLAYRYWRDLHRDDEPIHDADLFSELERGGASSLMTEEEYRRVRERLIGNQIGGATKGTGKARPQPRPVPPDRTLTAGAADRDDHEAGPGAGDQPAPPDDPQVQPG